MTLDAPALFRCLDAVGAATHLIPDPRLLPGDRMRLAGYTFAGSHAFTRAVAEGMLDEPGLFDDIPVSPESLLFRLGRGQTFLALHEVFTRLAQRAWDCHLIDHGGAVTDALHIHGQIQTECEQPFPPPRHEKRARKMRAATVLRKDRAARARQKGLRRARTAEAAAPPAPPASPAPIVPPPQVTLTPPRPSPQARAMKDADRLRGQQRLELITDSILPLPLSMSPPAAPPEAPPSAQSTAASTQPQGPAQSASAPAAAAPAATFVPPTARLRRAASPSPPRLRIRSAAGGAPWGGDEAASGDVSADAKGDERKIENIDREPLRAKRPRVNLSPDPAGARPIPPGAARSPEGVPQRAAQREHRTPKKE